MSCQIKDYKGIKIRLYPNKTQQSLINQMIGSNRFAYNLALSVMIDSYKCLKDIGKEHDKSLRVGFNEINKQFKDLRNDDNFKWLKTN